MYLIYLLPLLELDWTTCIEDFHVMPCSSHIDIHFVCLAIVIDIFCHLYVLLTANRLYQSVAGVSLPTRRDPRPAPPN